MSRSRQIVRDWTSRPLPVRDGQTYGGLVRVLKDAGLVGLGGAAFPSAVKLRAALDNDAGLIVNACDGEIGSAKDAYVVRHHLDELVRGARVVAGERVLFAAHRGSQTEAVLRRAKLHVLDVPTRYVSSEGTALINLAHGGLARPLVKHVPSVHGSRTAHGTLPPTLVLNAETVWRIDQIRRNGATWFRLHGTPDEPGPRLVTVNDAMHQVVLESQAGEPVAALLERAGIRDFAYVLVGGLSGTWLTGEEARQVAWSSVDLRRFGGRTGAGVIHAIPADECPLETVAGHLEYLGGETAGQCGPCMFGVPAVTADFLSVIDGSADAQTWDRLDTRAGQLAGRGACSFPDGVASYVISAMRVLREHLELHATQHPQAKEHHEQHHAHQSAFAGRAGAHVEARHAAARHRPDGVHRSRHLRHRAAD